jgi:hypothetical protein
MHVLVWTVATIGGVAPAGTILSWGLRFWLTSVPITCAWAGLATMVASLFRSPMIALLTVCGVFFVLFVVKLVGMATANAYVTYVYPNSLDALIMHPQVKRVMTGLGIAAGVAFLSTLGGSLIFQKRDV